MHFTTWVFYNFSLLFGCSLQFYQFTLMLRTEILRFSSSLKCASPTHSIRFTQTSFFVHRKNSRFQGSAHFSFTGKTTDFSAQHQGSLIKLKVATKNAWKTTENSGCSMHLFSRPYKIFCGQKMATKEQFEDRKVHLANAAASFSTFFEIQISHRRDHNSQNKSILKVHFPKILKPSRFGERCSDPPRETLRLH